MVKCQLVLSSCILSSFVFLTASYYFWRWMRYRYLSEQRSVGEALLIFILAWVTPNRSGHENRFPSDWFWHSLLMSSESTIQRKRRELLIQLSRVRKPGGVCRRSTLLQRIKVSFILFSKEQRIDSEFRVPSPSQGTLIEFNCLSRKKLSKMLLPMLQFSTSQNPRSRHSSGRVTFCSHRVNVKLVLFHIIKTYDKKLKDETYEACMTNESFVFPVRSIHFVIIELNTTRDIWNGKSSQFGPVIFIL